MQMVPAGVWGHRFFSLHHNIKFTTSISRKIIQFSSKVKL